MAIQSPFFNNRREVAGKTARGVMPAVTPAVATPVPAATPVTPTTTPAASQDNESRLTVGPNIKLKGVEITDCHTLVVKGSVEATMNSHEIHIDEPGEFKGSAEVDFAEIRGHFDGNLTVRDKLTIHATGKVTGRIRYSKVVIEEGGQLSGEVEFGTGSAARSAAARPTAQAVVG